MMKVSDPGRGAIRGSFRSLGLAAAAMLLLTAATGQRAEALSLINPGAVPSAKYASDGLTTEVRGGHGHGGFVAVEAAAFAAAEVAASGVAAPPFMAVASTVAARCSAAAVFAPARPSIAAATALPRRELSGIIMSARGASTFIIATTSARATMATRRSTIRSAIYPRRFCKVVWTYYGPRKICRYRPWHHHHWRYRHRLPVYW